MYLNYGNLLFNIIKITTSTSKRNSFKGLTMNGIKIFKFSCFTIYRIFKFGFIWAAFLFLSPLKASETFFIDNLRNSILEQIEDSDESTFNSEDFISEDSLIYSSDEAESIAHINDSDSESDSDSIFTHSLDLVQSNWYPRISALRQEKWRKSSKLKHPPHHLKGLRFDWDEIADRTENGLEPHPYLKNHQNRLQLGLENFGNTCFFNGAMKLLAADEHFVSAIKGKLHLESEARTTETTTIDGAERSQRVKKASRLKNHVVSLLNMIRQSPDARDKQKHYKNISKIIKKVFRDYRELYFLNNQQYPEALPGIQQDPEEFLQSMFDFIGYKDHSGFTLADTIKWDHEDSVRISGRTKNSILSLSIKPFGSPVLTTVQEAIDHFFQVERVSGSASNNFIDGNKQFKMLDAPASLLLQLKRYELDYITMQTKRVSHPVKVEPVQISLFDEEEGQEYIATYKPVAVEVHDTLGGNSINFGHYYTYVKVGENWVEHDDYRPPEINNKAEDDICKNAYLLKYSLESISTN